MHDGIVTQEEFERANACLREYTQREYVSGDNSPLNAKVRCGICGHCMKRSRGKSPYYLCHTPRLTNAFSCPEERIPESDIMDAVLDALHIQAYYAVDTERIWQEKHKHRRQDTGVILKTLNTLKDTLNQLEQQIKELYEDFALGEINKAEYMTMKSTALEKRDVVAARIETLEAEIETIGADGSLNNRFVDAFTKYAEVEELTAEIAEDVLHEVVIYPNHTLDIVWNYREDLQKLMLSAGVNEIPVK